MTDVPAIKIDDPIEAVPGVGPRTAAILQRLTIGTVGDLLDHVPIRYEQEHAEASIAEVDASIPDEDGTTANVAVRGEIAAIKVPPGRRPRIEATLEDDSGRIQLVWFNAPWLRNKLRPGMAVVAEGRAKRYRGYLQLANPQWRTVDDAEDLPARDARLRPVYGASEDLPSRRIEEFVERILEPVTMAMEDPLPERFRHARALRPLGEAYRAIHRPDSRRDATDGRRRLAYDELFLLQLGVMMKRRHLRSTLTAAALETTPDIQTRIRDRFPFDLTPDQVRVCGEIGNFTPRHVDDT